jgi:hypothetical protein
MKVYDKSVGKKVDVSDKNCLNCPCYWPRPDPGTFTQGQGYRSRGSGKNKEWLCGTREIRGCPYNMLCGKCGKLHAAYVLKCSQCGCELVRDDV